MDWAGFLSDFLEIIIFLALLASGYFWGRRNEQQHLTALARREKALRHVLVFASRYPPISSHPIDPLLVSGSVVLGGDYFRMFVAGLRKLVGGRFTAFEQLTARARREALLRLKDEARAAGCGVVFNVRFETTRIQMGARGGPATVEVLAYGTAFREAAGSVAESAFQRQRADFHVTEVDGFDLFKHPTSRGTLILAVAALLYLVFETFGGMEWEYLSPHPTLGIGLVASLAGLFTGLMCRRGGIPWVESLALSALLAGLAFGSVHYLALRLNALGPAPTPAIYTLSPEYRLTAQDPALPDLYLPEFEEYWDHVRPGSTQHVSVLRGWLGFWQYHRSEIVDRVVAYHATRQPPHPGPKP